MVCFSLRHLDLIALGLWLERKLGFACNKTVGIEERKCNGKKKKGSCEVRGTDCEGVKCARLKFGLIIE